MNDEGEYSLSAGAPPDIPDNNSKGPWDLITKEMTIPKILIKEETVDTNHDTEENDDISNEAEPHSSVKQEDHDITIKEEWDAISIEDSFIEYDITHEQLDGLNQDNMLKSEVPDVNVDDSGIGFDLSQSSEKDKKKGDSTEQLMLNMCRVTKHSHNGKENNGFLDGSDHYESVEKTKSYKASVRNFRCSKCAKPFKTKSHLNRHEKIHLQVSGEPFKIYQCHQCGVQFSRNDALTRHILNLHCELTEQRLHACPVCGKCFKSAGHVSRHSVVHGKQARHHCDSCGSSFSQQGDLRRHQAYAHGPEPPSRAYVCSICGKAYAKRTILLRHKASHIREKLLSCEICGREFTRKDCLFSHIKNKHIKSS